MTRWATVRQAVITGNIANANTAGYTAMDVEPFSAILDETSSVSLGRTQPGHLSVSGDAGDGDMRAWQTRQTDAPRGPRQAIGARRRDQPRLFARYQHRARLPPHAHDGGKVMIDPLRAATSIAGAGLNAQSVRLRIVSENLANANSTGSAPGADPYQRKTVVFASEFDRLLGAATVDVKQIGHDQSPFIVEHDPGNPAADADGNVKMPNVNMLVEMADMREASRSYEANLQMVKQARSMTTMILDLLRNA